jgi:Zn-dependent peptidase ImmA (M78 family)
MFKFRTDEEIEKIALLIRQKLGFEHQFAPDIFTLLQRLGQVKRNFHIEILSDDRLPSDEAYADCTAATIYVRESVFGAAREGRPRARMTIVHEIVHLLLGHTGTRSRSVGQDIRSKSSAIAKAEETEAKRFAGIFLAPSHLVGRFKTVNEVATAFQISGEAAQIRFDHCQAAKSKSLRKAGRSTPGEVLDYLREAERRGYPVRLTDLRRSEDRKIAKSEPSEVPARLPSQLSHPVQMELRLLPKCAACGCHSLAPDGNCLTCQNCGESDLRR